MSAVIGTISLSHSPLWNLAPDPEGAASGARFVGMVAEARELVARLRPDAIVVFGPDHARGLFYDLMPPFTIGLERVEGVGDYFTPTGELPLARALARAIYDGATARGFDIAVSLDMRVDHGLTQVYQRLVPELDIPIVPIIVNSGCPPLPGFARSADFGRAVGEAIAAHTGAERVLTLGSGGMSHWPASTSAFDESITPEWRDFLIHGRARVDELEPVRQGKALALAAGDGLGHVADDWDRDLLARVLADRDALARLDDVAVEALAGPGAHELRTWAAATAAWGGELAWSGYEPVPAWITGMGILSSVDPSSVPA